MEAITQRVNVVLSPLIKRRETRQSVTNVFDVETDEKTFNPHLIKVLKENQRERGRIKKKGRVHVLDQCRRAEFSCGLM